VRAAASRLSEGSVVFHDAFFQKNRLLRSRQLRDFSSGSVPVASGLLQIRRPAKLSSTRCARAGSDCLHFWIRARVDIATTRPAPSSRCTSTLPTGRSASNARRCGVPFSCRPPWRSQNVAPGSRPRGPQQGFPMSAAGGGGEADGTRIRSGASIARYSSGKRSRNTRKTHLQPQRTVGQLERDTASGRPDRARFVVDSPSR